MSTRGYLEKMRVVQREDGAVVDYYLRLSAAEVHLNSHLGGLVTLQSRPGISCAHCGEMSPRSYAQGYCYECFRTLARCDLCIVSPERCHFAAGTCREPDWGESFCNQPHVVYLANSSGIKVGITRPDQIPTRWIDQGAVQATPVVNVATRQQAGFVEVAFKAHTSDRTQWQRMLQADDPHVDMQRTRRDLLAQVEPALAQIRSRFGDAAVEVTDAVPTRVIRYPIRQYPTQVAALPFGNDQTISGHLFGIKGQYLILDTGVINLRKYSGCDVEFSASRSRARSSPGLQGSLF